MSMEQEPKVEGTSSGTSALSAGLGDADSWEANAQYMLERCPYTVWQRPGGGLVDLKATLVVTFQGMQMRLEGHPMFATPNV
jgi:hypothetical protein